MEKLQQRKVELPKENTEYTILMPNGKLYSYLFMGVNDQGRLLFLNTKKNYITNYSAGWFAKLKRQNRVRIAELRPEQEKPVKKLYELGNDADVLEMLCSLTPAQKISAVAKTGYSPAQIIKDYKNLMDSSRTFTQEYINRVMANVLTVSEIAQNVGVTFNK